MPQTARYYLSRVIKLGELDNRKLIDAITEPVSIARNNFHYTFIDTQTSGERPTYVFGRLAKYEPKAEVDAVETKRHERVPRNVPNLLVASSPFVFIPELSAIAYQHIWHHLETDQFERYFAELIIERHGGFFVDCSVQPISDLRKFIVRLSRLDAIRKIDATVFPPNPLFGPIWGPLSNYLRNRNLKEVSVKEQAKEGLAIETEIRAVADVLLADGGSAEEAAKLLEGPTAGMADAAVFMAADGYGKASIEGVQEAKLVTIRSRDTHRSFKFDRDPKPAELFAIAEEELKRINLERGLDHQ